MTGKVHWSKLAEMNTQKGCIILHRFSKKRRIHYRCTDAFI